MTSKGPWHVGPRLGIDALGTRFFGTHGPKKALLWVVPALSQLATPPGFLAALQALSTDWRNLESPWLEAFAPLEVENELLLAHAWAPGISLSNFAGTFGRLSRRHAPSVRAADLAMAHERSRGTLSIASAVDFAVRLLAAIETSPRATNLLVADTTPSSIGLDWTGAPTIAPDFVLRALLMRAPYDDAADQGEPVIFGGLPPELVRGAPVDDRSLVWKIGYYCLYIVGGGSVTNDDHVPRPLRAFLRACIADDPTQRPLLGAMREALSAAGGSTDGVQFDRGRQIGRAFLSARGVSDQIDALAATDELPVDLEALAVASPEDDATWLVIADWLQDHGNPRGELANIQGRLDAEVDDRTRWREAELLMRYPGLAPTLPRASWIRWRFGFADRLDLADVDANFDVDWLMAHPAMRFVRRVSQRTGALGTVRIARALLGRGSLCLPRWTSLSPTSRWYSRWSHCRRARR